METEFDHRLQDIRSGPWRELSGLARRRIAAMNEDDAAVALRWHGSEAIIDPDEIALRESYDQVLEELQLLELAVGSGYLPLETVEPVARAEFDDLLSTPAARNYLTFYDYVPIRFLAARLGIDLGYRALDPPPVDRRAGLRFATFLSIHSEFVASEPIERFTRLLDDYFYLGRIDARFFADTLEVPPGNLTAGQKRLHASLRLGFVEFVQYLGSLFEQLEADEIPLYGCVYAYWLSRFCGFRRAESGYERVGLSFADVRPEVILRPLEDGDVSGASEAQGTERRALAERIATLRSAWEATRYLLEKHGPATYEAGERRIDGAQPFEDGPITEFIDPERGMEGEA